MPTHRPPLLIALLTLPALLLTGCDLPGMASEADKLAQREAEGKAIGSACRHAVRGIEDCFAQNPKAIKAAVFTGWKEMDQYMRDNKIDGQPAQPGKPMAVAVDSHEATTPEGQTEGHADPKPDRAAASTKPEARASKAEARIDPKPQGRADTAADARPDRPAARAEPKTKGSDS